MTYGSTFSILSLDSLKCGNISEGLKYWVKYSLYAVFINLRYSLSMGTDTGPWKMRKTSINFVITHIMCREVAILVESILVSIEFQSS